MWMKSGEGCVLVFRPCCWKQAEHPCLCQDALCGRWEVKQRKVKPRASWKLHGEIILWEINTGALHCFSEWACFLIGHLKLRRRLTWADSKILLLNDKKNDSSIDSTANWGTLNGRWSILIWIDGAGNQGGITYWILIICRCCLWCVPRFP